MNSSVHRHRVILLHASFWAVYISFFVYYVSSFQHGPDIDWARIVVIVAVHMVGAMLISYINYFYFLPKFLFRKKVGMFIVVFVVAFSIIVFSRLQLERYFTERFFEEHDYLYRPRFVVQLVFSNLSIVIFVSLLRFAADWLDLQTTRKEIEKEKLTAELNFLKAQVNPHFLFNTLNNLYYLAYSKSDNTAEVIEKLSRMMRYMIYDSNYPQVQLAKEIEYMQNYISLEKLRLSDNVKINFSIEGDIDTVRITPLILITFLENAFKHGVTSTSKESWIEVSLVSKPGSVQFLVSNSKPGSTNSEEKSGIGLQNVKRRLDLSYPGKYKLDMDEQANDYRVTLSLDFT